MVQDSKRDNLKRVCRLQERGAVQGQSGSRQHVVAHRCGRREARLAWGGIREHKAFLGHEMRSPAGTGRGGVSMAGWREGQGAGKGEGAGGRRLPSSPLFFLEFIYVFGHSVSMKEVITNEFTF